MGIYVRFLAIYITAYNGVLCQERLYTENIKLHASHSKRTFAASIHNKLQRFCIQAHTYTHQYAQHAAQRFTTHTSSAVEF